jgi:hypothetical protein
MATLPQDSSEKKTEDSAPPRKLLQALVLEEAIIRIKIQCALRSCAPGEVISDLALKHLPSVPPQEIPNVTTDK